MSFLGDIFNSISSERAPPPPPKPTQRPVIATTNRPVGEPGKSVARPGTPGQGTAFAGTKRKAEGDLNDLPERKIKANPAPGLTSSVVRRPPAPPLNAPKPRTEITIKTLSLPINPTKPAVDGKTAVPSGSVTGALPAKAPTKGSYADILARAKERQQQQGQSNVGMIKHQATPKEKLSKLAERRRLKNEKNTDRPRPGARPNPNKGDKRRSTSPVKVDKERPRMLKPPAPPLNAPRAIPNYKGTLGMGRSAAAPSQREKVKKPRRADEYLATDEEDEGDFTEGEADDYWSDASSDNMEAGAFDLEQEEQMALKAARDDDARELALENQLKREKEERRKRLEALAKKNK